MFFVKYPNLTFELFDDEQLSLLVKVNRKNEEKEYYDLLSFVTESDCGLYTRFQKIIINNILGQDFEGKNYYEKYINVNNLNEFKRFFTYTNTEISGLIATFIKGLEVETDAADLLAPYRLDFVYNTYITAAISVREKIANRLGVAIDTKMDEAIKAIIFNENGKNDILKRAKQKDAIDSIISMVKKDDEIRIDGKLLSSKYTLLAIFVGFIFTLIGLLFFLSPIITKTIMLRKDFFEVFFSLYNQLTPLIMLYSFIFFVIGYLINVKKARGYVGQAIWLTIKKWFIYVLLPIILYALTYILIYCLI